MKIIYKYSLDYIRPLAKFKICTEFENGKFAVKYYYDSGSEGVIAICSTRKEAEEVIQIYRPANSSKQ